MVAPLVSVICLCYNQALFVEEAIRSVLAQTYAKVELIVVDDASTDESVEVIAKFLVRHPHVRFMPLKSNVGNCKAFNLALAESRGEYVIDLAADDVLLPERISSGVIALKKAGPGFGVNFCDADIIDESGKKLWTHSEKFPHHTVPQGDVYLRVIKQAFICSPTVMFTRQVISALEGYDESLLYEDFDFWVRSSREFFYCYTPEVLVKKRTVKKSMSEKQFKLFSPQQYSTFAVCRKIMRLNRTRDEREALAWRLRYEITVTLRLLMFDLAWKYFCLLIENGRKNYA